MGAGRSGTTILASLLGSSKQIQSLGEMHQFLEKTINKGECSCGKPLTDCEFWAEVIAKLATNYTLEEIIEINKHNSKIESHRRIFSSLLFKNEKYVKFQKELISLINHYHPSENYLDSTKYVSKALQLLRMENPEVKIIYVVRDVRGVIYSFGKKVQTQKAPIASIIYYSLINFFAEITRLFFGKKRVLKIRYEDIIENTTNQLLKIGVFLDINLEDVILNVNSDNTYSSGHFIGGNRMILKKNIKLKKDIEWKNKLSRVKQVSYYFLTLPFMVLNKYSI